MGASHRFDAPLIANAHVFGDGGLGVLAEAIASSGEHGPGYAFGSLSLPADNGKEIRGLITRWPTNGTLIAYEDTSFSYEGSDDSFDWQLYVDGVAVGSPVTVTLDLGDPTKQVVAASTSSSSATAGAAVAQTHRVAGGATTSASVSTGATVSVPGSSIVIGANSTSTSASSGAAVSAAGSHAVQAGDSANTGSSAPSAITQEHRIAAGTSSSASRSTGGATRGLQPRVVMAARIQFTALAARIVS